MKKRCFNYSLPMKLFNQATDNTGIQGKAGQFRRGGEFRNVRYYCRITARVNTELYPTASRLWPCLTLFAKAYYRTPMSKFPRLIVEIAQLYLMAALSRTSTQQSLASIVSDCTGGVYLDCGGRAAPN